LAGLNPFSFITSAMASIMPAEPQAGSLTVINGFVKQGNELLTVICHYGHNVSPLGKYALNGGIPPLQVGFMTGLRPDVWLMNNTGQV